jgi:hypothetical protein
VPIQIIFIHKQTKGKGKFLSMRTGCSQAEAAKKAINSQMLKKKILLNDYDI